MSDPKMVKVNGKNMPTEEALDLLKKDSVKVTKVQIEFDNPKKEEIAATVPLTSEGFAIEKAIISGLSKKMDAMGASYLVFSMTGSPYIQGRTLRIVLSDPAPAQSWLKRILLDWATKFVEKNT